MRELERPVTELAEYNRLPPQPPYQTPPAHGEFEATQPSVAPSHYVTVVWRQKWKILFFMAVTMFAAFLVSARLTPVYEATAKIDVDRALPTSVVGNEANQSNISGDDSDAFMATQMELIPVRRSASSRGGALPPART